MNNPDMSKEYSQEFDRLRRNRMEMSFYKYGPVRKNYATGNIRAIPTLKKCLEKYEETGNTEYLVDAANYAMLEFMYPQHPQGHFRPTGSEESAGIVGMSVKEMEEYRKNL